MYLEGVCVASIDAMQVYCKLRRKSFSHLNGFNDMTYLQENALHHVLFTT